jgi:hypothetical protein
MPDKDRFPYVNLPPNRYWRNAVAELAREDRDAQPDGKFQVDRSTAISSAGSCFAQRIADRLRKDGFNYLVTEPGPKWLDGDQRLRYDYGRYTARYGNVYTTLQMLQLLDRAMGDFEPVESAWVRDAGGYVDPFRPTIQPEGFSTIAELAADRCQHFARVLKAFEQSDVFIFTLGLTELWCDVRDGAAYPVCPGRGTGSFDASLHKFRNLDVSENIELLSKFVEKVRSINPALKILLTVSPVPLIATYSNDHVLRATSYSKAILLATARELQQRYPYVDYFGAYELLWSPCMPVESWAEDARTITSSGVEHVMRSFYRHYTAEGSAEAVPVRRPVAADEAPSALAVDEIFRTCDDELIMQALAKEAVLGGEPY